MVLVWTDSFRLKCTGVHMYFVIFNNLAERIDTTGNLENFWHDAYRPMKWSIIRCPHLIIFISSGRILIFPSHRYRARMVRSTIGPYPTDRECSPKKVSCDISLEDPSRGYRCRMNMNNRRRRSFTCFLLVCIDRGRLRREIHSVYFLCFWILFSVRRADDLVSYQARRMMGDEFSRDECWEGGVVDVSFWYDFSKEGI